MLNRFGAALLVAASLLATPATAAVAPSNAAGAAMTTQDLNAFFSGLIPYALARADIAGGVVIVVKDGKVIFQHGYGYADLKKRTPVIPDRTLFRPGSTSKLFTWTSVMQLVQAGKIDLDADVNQYLDFKINEPLGKITMRNLMTHTPGWEDVARDTLVANAGDLYPVREYLIKRQPPQIYRPGTTIAYSNYGATLAGYIVQRVSGMPFDDYVEKHIFTPLHMMHTTFRQPLPANLAPDMAQGYHEASNDKPIGFEFVEIVPAGAAAATATDMAHFMLAYLNGGTYDGYQLLKPATIAQMWTRQVEPAPGTNLNGFDLGFYQEDRNGQEVVSHAGDLIGFHSDLHLMPKDHVGIFMSFNSIGKAGAVETVRTQIFRRFLDRYYPYTAAVEPTVTTAKADAARVVGWYTSSRQIVRALRFVYVLGQSRVTARPDGTIEVSMLKDPAGDPLRWHEVGPLFYQQVNGQAHLKFNTDANGNVVSWSSDDFIPVEIQLRVNGMETLGSVKTLLLGTVIVFVLSLLVRLGGWIARRKLALRLGLTRREQWVHLVARLGIVLFIATLVGWMAILSNADSILSASFVPEVEVLYVLGVLTLIGMLGIIVETVLRVTRGPGGWLVRLGEILVGLGACYVLWFFLAFGMVNFVTNF
ncbi:MAG TPA: serine hydrolase domain-containing protein [Candidatus Acidoferrales bacterium]|nr:serine hydrolase domain-containing protein [Candidatus Acidoferrales bacterium]